MTQAQVQAAMAVVVVLIATWAGTMMAVALLLPKQAKRASEALNGMPWMCGATGLGLAILTIIGFVLLGVPAPPVKFVGFLLLMGLSALLCIGGAGVALLMGDRISEMSGARTSFAALVRGSVVYSLAVGFPFIGWFLFAPLSIIFALGAGVVALWPSRVTAVPPMTPPAPRPDYDLMERQGAI
ncbi:MAG: hypothetical protein JWL77_4239 [Chthonomonadaceae bacterium]|nr:hypothetical protein [Chthonomonadaceae bacterium]